jgi:hypothetical protein
MPLPVACRVFPFMSIVSAFYIVSMLAAPFVMAPLHPPY